MINYKLRLFTPRSSYGAKEMAPKSQLCACSFQDSLRQKNWALEQIRKFPDTIGYVWTAETIRIRCVWTRKFSHPQKNICGKKDFRIRVDMALRRHKKDKNNITKFSYVLVNLIFQLSLASGKPRIELKKVNRSINTGKVSLYCNLIFFLKITSQS